MPRNYKRPIGSRRYKDYTEETLENAIQQVTRGRQKLSEASKIYNIPRRTLLNKIKNRHQENVGAPTILSEALERSLADVIVACAEFGSPLTMLDLRFIVKSHLDKEGTRVRKFKNNLPGVEWGYSFLKRHKHRLTQRQCQNIKRVRAEKTEEEFINYFNNLERSLQDVAPCSILNYDETNLTDDPGSKKCIFRRGTKYPERVMNSTKTAISIMFAVTASGEILPPYTVYKAERIYDQWCVGGPPGARYNRTKSGWFDSASFQDWFMKVVLPWAKKLEGPKVLIGDNLSSHINIEVLRECQRANIRFVFLPSNSTHLTQPLDVSFFRPLKIAWRSILTDYKLKNPRDSTLNKTSFPTLLRTLMNKIEINQESIIKNGFKKTGIFPLDKNSVLKSLPGNKIEGTTQQIGDTVVNYLKEMRTPAGPKEIKRKKMVRVEPGKSVCFQDVTNLANNVEMRESVEDAIEDYQDDDAARTQENDETFDEPDLPQFMNLENQENIENSNSSQNSDNGESINEGDFVIVAFKTQKSTVNFIAKILRKDEDDFFEVKFLRKRKTAFRFPDEDDISHVRKSEIVKVLQQPECPSSSRDLFYFRDDLTNFKFN